MNHRRKNWIASVKKQLQHAFAVSEPPLGEEEKAVLDKVGQLVVRKKMETPAVLLLESSRGLNFVASQGLAFFTPLVEPFLSTDDFRQFIRALEKRASIDYLQLTIETALRDRSPAE